MDFNTSDVAALVICGVVGLAVAGAGAAMLTGRGAFLIAGYNTMSKARKEKYDEKALCRFTGKIMLPIGLLTPFVAISGIFGAAAWFGFVYTAVVSGLVIFAVTYVNTGDRFRKR
jgi:hypothetical protein